MKVLSLFTGIAGIDRGLQHAGFTIAAYSEWDPGKDGKGAKRQYAADVLAARYPTTPNLGDISKIEFWNDGESMRRNAIRYAYEDSEGVLRGGLCGKPNIVAGGFPCQDVSAAGKGAGIKVGTRSGLWFEMERIIEELQPEGVLIENVANLSSKGLDEVLMGLARLGYDAEWDVIAAAAVGAPHLRERLFVIAWPRGRATHGGWPEPEPHPAWRAERDVPRLISGKQMPNRAARLKALGNAVVPQVAAHVASILWTRLYGGENHGDDWWDAKHGRGEKRGMSKCVGSALPFGPMCDGEIAPPTIAGAKLPRAGRMTHGDVYERVRSVPQGVAKKIGLANMAPTLRPRPDDHPELPHEGLVPTPNASVANDGEGADTWIERKVAHATKAENPTRASMPLAIYAQVKPDERLLPTPTAKDADSSRSRTAVRQAMPARISQMGETLTDYVDPTNGGRLLPTPCATDHKGPNPLERRPECDDDLPTRVVRLLPTPTTSDGGACDGEGREGADNLVGAAKLLPTMTVADAEGSRASKGAARPNEGGLQHTLRLLPTPKATDGDKGVRSQASAVAEMARGKGGDLDAATKLLPAPRVYDAEHRGSGPGPAELAGTTGMALGSAVHLLPTPVASDHRSGAVSDATLGKNSRPLREIAVQMDAGSGRLNPEWVEWLMGFPLNYTRLD